jgi:hypothetical protein
MVSEDKEQQVLHLWKKTPKCNITKEYISVQFSPLFHSQMTTLPSYWLLASYTVVINILRGKVSKREQSTGRHGFSG